jgi:hypothetical protein
MKNTNHHAADYAWEILVLTEGSNVRVGLAQILCNRTSFKGEFKKESVRRN